MARIIKQNKSFYNFVQQKLDDFANQKHDFANLFAFMFREREEILGEKLLEYSIKYTTYGECADTIKKTAFVLNKLLSFEKGSIIGLSMSNSIEWIQVFWSILQCGYRPLLINSRLPIDTIENIISTHSVKAVITDEVEFSCKTIKSSLLYENLSEDFIPSVWGDEVLFMSSGTSNNVKLCAYNGENFYAQICSSKQILDACPQIGSHYEGKLKHLAILPFYHVFGFIAVYLWFTFFSRTLVFLKDNKPSTILLTIRTHKVTHVFAVPLLFEKLYYSVKQKAKLKGEKTYRNFKKSIALCSNGNKFYSLIFKKSFDEIRLSTLGPSVQFLISGGSAIRPSALKFFNALGYFATTGYGMTEVGITSVNISSCPKIRNSLSVGFPISNGGGYKINENGELLIKGNAVAYKIITSSQTYHNTDWYNSSDLSCFDKNGYYILGRKDDMLVCKNGENLNPEMVENLFDHDQINGVCLFSSNNKPTLLVSLKSCYNASVIQSIKSFISNVLSTNHLLDEIDQIVYTTTPLFGAGDFKKSRKKIKALFESNHFAQINLNNLESTIEQNLNSLSIDIINAFSYALQKPVDQIGVDSDFFTDLGGTSLDYFALVDYLKENYSLDVGVRENVSLTVKIVCDLIKQNEK